ncbi:MAG TPA: carotenoid oxygenase family protein [Pyrinomonadaceae bacterium]|nr:carotenoid oxygenase family protein [Pyrinomonadaceae bacterium]
MRAVRDYAPLLERAFGVEPREGSYEVTRVEGRVPEFVRGTYYLNGPARFSRGGFRYRHWLDGDGMVCSLRFGGGGVRFTSRFVRTRKFVEEGEAGRPLFRAFGTAFESDRLRRGGALESPANISVYPYRDALLAFGEQGLPAELDPLTLETRGAFGFGGALNEVSPFAAHPKFDRETGEVFNFGVAFSASEPALSFYRFDAGGALALRRRLPLEHPCTVHDFGLSRSYAVFYLSPYLLDVESFVAGGLSLMDSLRWEPRRGSRLLVVSRETGEPVASVPVGARYCLHLVNCFERGGLLYADVLELDRPVYDQYRNVPDLFTDVCEGRPVRYALGAGGREVVARQPLDYPAYPDLPSVDPRRAGAPCEEFWMLGISSAGRRGRKFFDQLVHADWAEGRPRDIYQAPPLHYLCGEPVFVPDPGRERGGAVICQVFDAARASCAFAVFDAGHVSAGPLATLRLDAPVHFGFHAAFQPEGPRPTRGHHQPANR